VAPTRDLPPPRAEDRLPDDRAPAGPAPVAPAPTGPRVDVPPPVWEALTGSSGTRDDGSDGPPPPPAAAVRRDGPARRTAATIVAATGALLLLAAAATFLAVSWDQLGLPARVAAVGAGTAGAIVGGARLRRTLPAVGAVVFHLGALLLPVDALGLALQLEAGPATRWIAVGAVTVVTLPVAAHVGRSRVLAVAALAGVPILATGVGLAGGWPAPLVTAAAGAAALVVAGRGAGGPVRTIWSWAAPALATVAVAGPLVVAGLGGLTVATGGAPLATAGSAGWLPSTWTASAVVGLVAVAVVTAAAARQRSAALAGAVPVLVALAAVGLLLPGDAPRLARLLPWPLLLLAVEAAALAVRRDPVLAVVGRRAATVAEALAAWTLPAALGVVATATRDAVGLLGFGSSAPQVDLPLAAVAGVTAVGWAVAIVRRRADDGVADGGGAGVGDGAGALAVATAGLITGAAAVTLVLPAGGIGVAALLAWVGVVAVHRGGGPAGALASAVVVVLGATLVVGTWATASLHGLTDGVVGATVAAAAAAVAVAVTLRTDRHAASGGPAAAVVLLPAVLLAVTVAGGASIALGTWVPSLVAGGLLVTCAALLARLPGAADLLRYLGAAVVLLVPGVGVGLAEAATGAVACLVVGLALTADAVRLGRPHLFVAAWPVLARAVAGVVFAITGSPTGVGAALLLVALGAAVAAVVGEELRAAGTVTALLAAVPAVTLLSLTPTALAWAVTATGAAVVATGLLVRRSGVAHVGGLVTIAGIWQLLAIHDVTAVDVWLAAPALQLWCLALPARRAGTMSSWTADVPPLLLVVVPAVLERLAGGGGWHAAAAGALAVTAVVAGGAGRHGGPLVVGVVTLVVVVGIETLAVAAAVPTWAWLTVGGAVLLGAAAAIERAGDGPVAGARRLVDVLAERFD
jgi:hypothetical protein